ncbi:MAG: YraN family protein [Alphaproteobacteria bacterium]|nr:YraN family protein [Alphaproteobacteria bacterium]
MKRTYQFGLLAEKIAMIFLWLKGYKILAWRYKNSCGEIDIIAKKGQVIVLVEVKARRSELLVEEVLRPHQLSRIKRSAELFIAQNPQFQNHDLRFDFIEVGKNLWPKHQKNFWE